MVTKREFWTVLGISAALLAVFALFDLPISIALYDPESLFGKLFEVIGELPAALAVTFSGAVFLLLHDGQGTGRRIFGIIGGGIAWLFGCLMCGVMPLSYVENPSTAVRVVLVVAAAALSILLVLRLPKEAQPAARRVALVGVLLFFTVIIGFNAIKMLWGRMRFRAMTAPYEGFSLWLLPQGPTTDNEFMSFPSGHTAQSMLMLMITLLPCVFHKLTPRLSLLKGVAYAWAVLVAASRVVMGAHFASDVTVGFLVTFLLFNLWCGAALKKDRAAPLPQPPQKIGAEG